MSTSLPSFLVVTSLGVAVVAVCFPVLLVGVPRSLPLFNAYFGLIAGFISATFVGPVAVALLTGRDFDQGTRADRIALGGYGFRLAAIQLLLALIAAAVAVAAGTLLVSIATLADRLARSATGGIDTQHIGNHNLLLLALLPPALTTVLWLLTVATRSGRRGLTLLAVTLASWAALAPAIAQSPARDLLMAHPLALPWSLIHPFDSSRFDFTAPWWQLAPGALVWISVLGWAAVRNSRRPGKRR